MIKKKQIIIGFWGGLGNQLFTYALGRALSLKFNAEYIIDKSFYSQSQNYYSSEFKIDNLNISKDIKISENFSSNFFKYIKLYKKVSNKKIINNNFFKLIYGKYLDSVYLEREFFFDKDVLNYNEGNKVFYYGYWQSRFYFENIKSLLSTEFIPKNLNISKFENLKKNISSNTVAIHFRGTDSIGDITTYDIPQSYYIKGINYYKKKFKNLHFHIFTDDIEYAKKQVKNIFNNQDDIFFIHENQLTDIEEFHLLRFYSNYIIPHSTFSWWAAYLSFKNNKEVLLPPFWFVNEKTKTDFISENMSII